MFLRKILLCCVFFLALNGSDAFPVIAGQEHQFTVQVETVSFEPAARAVARRLSARGYDAYFESHTASDGKVLYKVRFGRFASRKEASAAAKAYKKNEQRDCFVVQTVAKAGSPARTAAVAPTAADLPAAGPGGAGAKPFYTVQVAAKSDRAVAQAFADRLRRKGYPAYLRNPVAEDDTPFYRIRFGRYKTRSQAEQAGGGYAKNERGEYLVVLSEPGRPEAEQPQGPAAVAKERPRNAGHFFTVQLGVCKTRKAAENHADSVRAKGFEPYIVTYETSKGKTLYRVRIGQFKERSRAVKLARAYEQKGGRDFLVVRSGQLPASTVSDTDDSPVAELVHAAPQESRPVQEPVVSGTAEVGRSRQEPASKKTVSADVPTRSGSAASGAKPAAGGHGVKNGAVTKIYAYAGPGNELNLTNAYAKIPRELLERIQYVSIFPVMFVAVAEKGNALVMEIEGERRFVRLSGLKLPEEKRAVASAGIKDILSAAPLRLKYHPDDERGDVLTATLYYRNGTDLQIELVKRGLALVDEQKLPADRLASLRAAQQRAQGLKVGIWSGRTP